MIIDFKSEEMNENPFEYKNIFGEANPFYENDGDFYGDIYGKTNVIDLMDQSEHINAFFGNDDSSSSQIDYELVVDNRNKEKEPNTSENSEKSTEAKTIKEKIFEITKEKKNTKEPIENTKEPKEIKLLEKKREREGNHHTKDSFDNILRKIKSKIFDSILIVMNKSLEVYKTKKEEQTPSKNTQKQKKGEVKKECFLKLQQSIIIDTNISSNKKLLSTPLREIFSQKVSEKMKNYSKDGLDYNKNFIEKIKNDENKAKTNAILDMTFFECIEHFRGTKYYEVLSGLEKEYEITIEDLKARYDDDDYIKSFIAQLNSFEELLENKKSRKSRKNKNEEKI